MNISPRLSLSDWYVIEDVVSYTIDTTRCSPALLGYVYQDETKRKIAEDLIKKLDQLFKEKEHDFLLSDEEIEFCNTTFMIVLKNLDPDDYGCDCCGLRCNEDEVMRVWYTFKLEYLVLKIIPSDDTLVIHEKDKNTVFEIDKEWFFENAKNWVPEDMKAELKLVQSLKNKISVPIPQIDFYFENRLALRYKKIEGISLTAEIYHEMNNVQKQQFADDLAQFMYELQTAVSPKDSEEHYLKAADWPLDPDALETQLFKHNGHWITADYKLMQTYDKFIKKYRDVAKMVPYMVIHNNLHPNNIFIDPVTKKISGIINFSSASIGNAYHEFRYLHLIDIDLVAKAVEFYVKKKQLPLISHPQVNTIFINHVYLYCLATEFSQLAKTLENDNFLEAAEIKTRIEQLSIVI